MSGRRADRPTARRSPALTAFFERWFAGYVARHLNAVRIARWGRPDARPDAAPVVVYANHPSWWDAALYVVLNGRLFPGAAGFGPMDADMVRRYPFFARIGAVPVDLGTVRGAAAFLAAADDVLSAPGRVMWVAAQGRFADVRDRPPGLRAGIARLPEGAPNAVFLPMAVEYVFWTERGAEALVAFGPPRTGADLARLPRADRLAAMEADLALTMDRLAADARSRDPARFDAVLDGRAGVGGIYDLWRGATARLHGRRFDPAHGAGILRQAQDVLRQAQDEGGDRDAPPTSLGLSPSKAPPPPGGRP